MKFVKFIEFGEFIDPVDYKQGYALNPTIFTHETADIKLA